MSQLGGIDPMAKWKRKRDAESGGGILTLCNELGKNEFLPKDHPNAQISKKNFQIPKGIPPLIIQRKLSNHLK